MLDEIDGGVVGPRGGQIVAEFFDVEFSRSVPWERRPEPARLLVRVEAVGSGWPGVVVGRGRGVGMMRGGESPSLMRIATTPGATPRRLSATFAESSAYVYVQSVSDDGLVATTTQICKSVDYCNQSRVHAVDLPARTGRTTHRRPCLARSGIAC